MARSWKSRRIDPTVDCVFKKMLGSPESKALTLDFLNALMGLAGSEPLSDLTFEDPHLHKLFQDDKRPVVDVLVTVGAGDVIQIEIQASLNGDLVFRFVFDWSKLLSSTLKEGDSYREMKGAISIWILTENLFPHELTEEVVLKFRIYCPEARLGLQEDSYILVVQLKNWKGHGTLDPAAERWIMLFREGKNFDLNHPPECLDDEVMRMALEVMKNFAKDRSEYLRYERELKRRRVNDWHEADLLRQIDAERRAKEEALALSLKAIEEKEEVMRLLAEERRAREEMAKMLERFLDP